MHIDKHVTELSVSSGFHFHFVFESCIKQNPYVYSYKLMSVGYEMLDNI